MREGGYRGILLICRFSKNSEFRTAPTAQKSHFDLDGLSVERIERDAGYLGFCFYPVF